MARSGTVVCRLQQGDATKEQGTGGAILHRGKLPNFGQIGLEMDKIKIDQNVDSKWFNVAQLKR